MSYLVFRTLALVCLACMVAATGCHSWHVDTIPATPTPHEYGPDTIVRITRTDGTQDLMRGIRVENGDLLGERVIDLYGKRDRTNTEISSLLRVPVSAIRFVEVWTFETGKTLALTLALTGVATVVALYVIVGSGLAGLAAHD